LKEHVKALLKKRGVEMMDIAEIVFEINTCP
jgi:hypothetical protein